MKDGFCSKLYCKKFYNCTILDADGYPLYQWRDAGNTVTKNGVLLDNNSVVPYNQDFLLRYHAHINIEWCN